MFFVGHVLCVDCASRISSCPYRCDCPAETPASPLRWIELDLAIKPVSSDTLCAAVVKYVSVSTAFDQPYRTVFRIMV